ncbi:MAG: PepSY domain-containing protein [Beijerinckiaceae bacterium]|nr:PepSY domain-containing protein [Beijerinckiaceae bacterium]
MRHIVFALAAICAGTVATAQTASPPANPNPSTPAISNTDRNNPGAPAAGANSFTEGQAKSRIESAGYANVTGLVKDENGVWRGKGSKGGKAMDVSLDYQGNIVAK